MSLVGGYCRVVSAFRGAFCCALPDIFRSFRTRPGVGADGPTGASTGRSWASRAFLDGAPSLVGFAVLPACGPGAVRPVEEAQAGAALQLCFQCVQPAVARFGGDFGDPESGDGRGRRGRLGRDRGRVSVSGVSACGARAGASTVGVDGVAADAGGAGSRPTRGGVLPGRCRHVPVPGLAAAAGAVAATARGWRPTRRCAPNWVCSSTRPAARARRRSPGYRAW